MPEKDNLIFKKKETIFKNLNAKEAEKEVRTQRKDGNM